MKNTTVNTEHTPCAMNTASGIDRLARKIVHRQLRNLRFGELNLGDDRSQEKFGHTSSDFPLVANVRVNDPRFYSDIAFAGVLGAAESYMSGYWQCDDLTRLVRILLRNRQVMEQMDSGSALVTRPLQKALHWLNQNTRKGSRRNIGAHYDLGNDFFGLWLDRRMMYSSAVFEHPDMTLDDAGTAKLHRICRKLDLGERDHVIEIGTGWGGFAIFAAQHYGCKVTTATISEQQYTLATERVREAGVEDKVTLLLKDYRDLYGKFDKLVSIEMIEAVGYEYHDVFFRKCSELLKPDGLMCLQAITIEDQRYEKAKKSVDFIQRYIFPGGCLTSLTAMVATVTSHTDMRITNTEDFGPHYAMTLQHWHERFSSNLGAIRKLGYTDQFIRMWHYYLAYCEGAFIERAIGVVQLLLARPQARAASVIGRLD